ncbi:MAG: hypothetical protein ACNS64_13035, partial [Candidatus Halalkalibacterium sp. M3_1C_030]
NVSYYLEKKKEEEEALKVEPSSQNGSGDKKNKELSRKEERRIEAEMRQARYQKIKPLKNKLEKIESRIEKLEKRKKEIENIMADSGFYDDSEQVKETTMEYDKLKAELVEVYSEWEELAMKVSEIEEEFEL